MTLGVLVRNATGAVLLSDRRKTYPEFAGTSIHSDHEEKILFCDNDTLPYAFAPAGLWEHFVLLRERITAQSYASFDELTGAVNEAVHSIETEEHIKYRTAGEKRLLTALEGLPPEYFEEKLHEHREKVMIEELEERAASNDELLLVGRDGDAWHAMRFFNGMPHPITEHFETIGSGKAIASAYLFAHLVSASRLDNAALVRCAFNTYQTATITNTIGGTPDVVNFSDTAQRLSFDACSLLMNLSGAYLARLVSHKKYVNASTAILRGDVEAGAQPLLRMGESLASLVSTGLRLPTWNARAAHPLYQKFLV